MLSHTGTLWQYLGSFVLYTLGAVGLIYAAYWYARRSIMPAASPSQADAPQFPLAIEATLGLEPHKTLYVIRSGDERFLISVSGESTQLLSKLETPISANSEIPVVPETQRLEPWFAQHQAVSQKPQSTLSSRFIQSVQWLVSSRMK